MNQSLDAADLDWHAWLTTNYTRFADRAIGLQEVRQEDGKDERSRWQIISTSIEARSFTREVLHGGHLRTPDKARTARYLFKLHGDVAHLQTMATAGYDKELFNSLCVPIDSLHEVYSAAEIFLAQSLRALHGLQGGPPLIWHVVGHGLNDWLLLQLIGKVCRQARSSSIWFVMVSRKPTRTADSLRDFLDKDKNVAQGLAQGVIPHPAKAEEYLAHIRRTGGLPEIRTFRSLQTWLSGLRGPQVGLASRLQGGPAASSHSAV